LGVCLGSLTRDTLDVPLYVWWMRLWMRVWPDPSFREVIELARQSTALIPYGLVLGASIGVMQWFVLRKRLDRSYGWILASALDGR